MLSFTTFLSNTILLISLTHAVPNPVPQPAPKDVISE